MQIQINTDSHIQNSTELRERATAIIEKELKHQRHHLTRIELHLSNGNSSKSGAADKRCVIEARPAGLNPLSSEHNAPDIQLAITEAARQLTRALDTALAKANFK